MDAAPHDLVILGGGCAGLSLGVRLAERPGRCARTLLLEARTTYRDDRTWCFWRMGAHRHDALVDHAWQRVTVRAGDRRVDADCAATPYQQLRSGAFYADACATIDASRSVALRRGVQVRALHRHADGGWTVHTDQGELRARAIVDTRPGTMPALGGATLWQSFVGDEVECDGDAFDPARATLMDFDSAAAADGMVAFTYVLPTTARRALVETTVLCETPLPAPALASRHADAIARACGGRSPRTLRHEHGILPMGLRGGVASPGPGHVRAGVVGGAARPASGYAFARIQRWADACASPLRQGGGPIAHARDPAMTRWMDALFLRVLATRPDCGAEIFVRLFQRVETPRLVRFLADCPTLLDRAAVIRALPPRLFLGHVGRTSPRRRRGPERAA